MSNIGAFVRPFGTGGDYGPFPRVSFARRGEFTPPWAIFGPPLRDVGD
jgi:hypothetical protein